MIQWNTVLLNDVLHVGLKFVNLFFKICSKNLNFIIESRKICEV